MTTETMIAIDIARDDGGPRLVPGEAPRPLPGAGEVAIKVAAAGVNRPDLMQVAGMYPPPPGASPILGLEVAGTVAALGPGVTDLAVGDPVCALLTGGGYAAYAIAPAAQCLPIPAGLSAIEAAALPETFFTVWHNVFEKARLTAGETFLVHGGSSGIGVAAIQMAKAFGAQVVTTAGSAEKCAACRDLGADLAIDYRQQDFVSELAAVAPKGADVILDMVGGDYVGRNLKCAAPDGRIVIIAFLKGPKTEVNFTPLLLKRLTLMGATLRAQPVAAKARIARGLREKVWPRIEKGDIKPVISATFPLADAQRAHELLASSRHIGKVVLTLD